MASDDENDDCDPTETLKACFSAQCLCEICICCVCDGCEGNELLLILWWLCGGLFVAAGWLFLTAISFISIIGYCTGLTEKCWNITKFCFCPIGSRIQRQENKTDENESCCQLNCCCNFIWIVFVGWFMALLHIFCAAILAIFCICDIRLAEHHCELAIISIFPYKAEIEYDTVATDQDTADDDDGDDGDDDVEIDLE